MNKLVLTALLVLTLVPAGLAHAGSYDAAADYMCDASTSDAWSYDGYRASDDSYLEMVFGRAPLAEVTKYGIDAHYLPDSDQPYYPFITRFTDSLTASPATTGGRFDAVITWTAPEAAHARFSGYARLIGNMKEEFVGKNVKVLLFKDGQELWSSEVSGGQTVEFDVEAEVASGDKVHMHIVNAGDDAGNLTNFNLKVSTAQE